MRKYSLLTMGIFIVCALFLTTFLKPSYGNNRLISPLASENSDLKQSSDGSSVTYSVEIENNTLKKKINILLLGLDARKGDTKPRCDAIHIISIDPTYQEVIITSIPRGTLAEKLPDEKNNYIANICHREGIDQAIPKIEEIAGIKIDKVIKLGFSQTLGLLRIIRLPTTATLQFLRNRSYGIGDHQRSHNQALFLKDSMQQHIEKFALLPKPLQYIAYTMLDTSLSFEEITQIINTLLQMKLHEKPEKILLVTKPVQHQLTKGIHFYATQFATDIQRNNDEEFQTYQQTLMQYIDNLVHQSSLLLEQKNNKAAFQLINTPFQQQIWLQIEYKNKRDHYQFDLLKIYVLSSAQKHTLSPLVLDFMTEMEQSGQSKLYDQATDLLSQLM